MTADRVFKLWVRASVGLLVAFVVWNYVPILIPLAVICGGLALFTMGVKRLAVHYRSNGDHPPAD
jgi:hypothetical protein